MTDHVRVIALLFGTAGCALMTLVSITLFESPWLVGIFAFLTGALLPSFLKLRRD